MGTDNQKKVRQVPNDLVQEFRIENSYIAVVRQLEPDVDQSDEITSQLQTVEGNIRQKDEITDNFNKYSLN